MADKWTLQGRENVAKIDFKSLILRGKKEEITHPGVLQNCTPSMLHFVTLSVVFSFVSFAIMVYFPGIFVLQIWKKNIAHNSICSSLLYGYGIKMFTEENIVRVRVHTCLELFTLKQNCRNSNQNSSLSLSCSLSISFAFFIARKKPPRAIRWA